MFVIVHNNQVILGPMPWRKLFFQNVIEEDTGVKIILPQVNTTSFIVDSNTSILPVIESSSPAFNPKIQHLDGPFWNIVVDSATSSYIVKDLDINLVKHNLKTQAAAIRWDEENRGIKLTINGMAISVDTSRDGRNIYLQSFQLGVTNTAWKFTEGWINLTNADLGIIVNAIATHVKTCFTWENTKSSEIDACSTLQQLDAVVVKYGV